MQYIESLTMDQSTCKNMIGPNGQFCQLFCTSCGPRGFQRLRAYIIITYIFVFKVFVDGKFQFVC